MLEQFSKWRSLTPNSFSSTMAPCKPLSAVSRWKRGCTRIPIKYSSKSCRPCNVDISMPWRVCTSWMCLKSRGSEMQRLNFHRHIRFSSTHTTLVSKLLGLMYSCLLVTLMLDRSSPQAWSCRRTTLTRDMSHTLMSSLLLIKSPLDLRLKSTYHSEVQCSHSPTSVMPTHKSYAKYRIQQL